MSKSKKRSKGRVVVGGGSEIKAEITKQRQQAERELAELAQRNAALLARIESDTRRMVKNARKAAKKARKAVRKTQAMVSKTRKK